MNESIQQPDAMSQADLDLLLGQANKGTNLQNGQLSQVLSSLSNDRVKDANFLHLQVSTQEMLDKLEHFYRGDVWTLRKKGDKILGYGWEKQQNKDLITFNEYGVTSLMEIVTKYIDRNTILSSYSEERIFEIIGDLGDELTLFILCNYTKIGMDTYFKKTKFRIIIISTLHIIESTYRRALRGKTLEEINQAKVVGQFGESPQNNPQMIRPPQGFISRQFNH